MVLRLSIDIINAAMAARNPTYAEEPMIAKNAVNFCGSSDFQE